MLNTRKRRKFNDSTPTLSLNVLIDSTILQTCETSRKLCSDPLGNFFYQQLTSSPSSSDSNRIQQLFFVFWNTYHAPISAHSSSSSSSNVCYCGACYKTAAHYVNHVPAEHWCAFIQSVFEHVRKLCAQGHLPTDEVDNVTFLRLFLMTNSHWVRAMLVMYTGGAFGTGSTFGYCLNLRFSPSTWWLILLKIYMFHPRLDVMHASFQTLWNKCLSIWLRHSSYQSSSSSSSEDEIVLGSFYNTLVQILTYSADSLYSVLYLIVMVFSITQKDNQHRKYRNLLYRMQRKQKQNLKVPVAQIKNNYSFATNLPFQSCGDAFKKVCFPIWFPSRKAISICPDLQGLKITDDIYQWWFMSIPIDLLRGWLTYMEQHDIEGHFPLPSIGSTSLRFLIDNLDADRWCLLVRTYALHVAPIQINDIHNEFVLLPHVAKRLRLYSLVSNARYLYVIDCVRFAVSPYLTIATDGLSLTDIPIPYTTKLDEYQQLNQLKDLNDFNSRHLFQLAVYRNVLHHFPKNLEQLSLKWQEWAKAWKTYRHQVALYWLMCFDKSGLSDFITQDLTKHVVLEYLLASEFEQVSYVV